MEAVWGCPREQRARDELVCAGASALRGDRACFFTPLQGLGSSVPQGMGESRPAHPRPAPGPILARPPPTNG